jgi:mono/diheme cytochrome c family protein
VRALLFTLALAGCGAEHSTAWQLAEGGRYLDDAGYRRDALVRSLANPDNAYSTQRLASYGRGWERLPEWRPRSRTLEADDAAAIMRGGIAALADRPTPPPLWDGTRPTELVEWIALGERVFFGFPLRPEPLMEWALTAPELAESFGVTPLPDGSYPGLRVIVDLDGATRVGITCALCHAAASGGDALVAGRARRNFDYGSLRLAYHAATGVPVEPDLARRMRTWGPGRADVTEDDEDPVAIPDLWGLAAQSALTQAGTIRQDDSPVALALRQETQYLQACGHRARPPRELALALALYLRSLQPPPNTRTHDQVTARGARLFAQGCVGCHDNAALGGPPVSAATVGTDPALANGHARGTGRYRPPALLDVRDAAPYLHDGSVVSLDALLSPSRLTGGHRYGAELDDDDRAALIAFLGTL